MVVTELRGRELGILRVVGDRHRRNYETQVDGQGPKLDCEGDPGHMCLRWLHGGQGKTRRICSRRSLMGMLKSLWIEEVSIFHHHISTQKLQQEQKHRL
ncbi:hypothetical protein QN277_000269 [Acacia crassicarpa]|uniref:Uncharacterized protein n=1 Tax=Acacia crassicarpa TaxID=499986 RepID=A0AAE1N657_9FABA|nr:hypothetical protein QN277_000269 [Acacia crassicarpa]